PLPRERRSIRSLAKPRSTQTHASPLSANFAAWVEFSAKKICNSACMLLFLRCLSSRRLQLPLFIEEPSIHDLARRARIRILRDVDDGPVRQFWILQRIRPVVTFAEREARVKDD